MIKKLKKNEISENEKPIKYYYERENRFHFKKPDFSNNRFFSTTRGKFTLIIITLFVLSTIWMSNNILKKSSFTTSIKITDAILSLYAFQIENTKNILINLYIKNITNENKLYRFEKIFVEILDEKNKSIVYKQTFLERLSIFIDAKKSEILQTTFRNAELKKIYKIKALFIDFKKERYSIEMKIELK